MMLVITYNLSLYLEKTSLNDEIFKFLLTRVADVCYCFRRAKAQRRWSAS